MAHPLRVRILGMLRSDGADTATGLANRLGLSSAATAYHLRQARGVRVHRRGRRARPGAGALVAGGAPLDAHGRHGDGRRPGGERGERAVPARRHAGVRAAGAVRDGRACRTCRRSGGAAAR
nr:helix-turn-helix domain-containing protein [Angustibacter aerolatus]